jgi:hypothetical protein
METPMTSYIEILNAVQKKTAETGHSELFALHASSPIKVAGSFNKYLDPLALGLLAGPSIYHMATGKKVNDDVADAAEVGGLGRLIYSDLKNIHH